MIVLDPKTNDSSFVVNLLRGLSAQVVCIGHALSFFKIEAALPPHFPYMQNIGVLIFFIISGFVIAHTLSLKSLDPSYTMSRYFVDRFARIYSGLIPSLAIIALIDGILIAFGRYDFSIYTYDFPTLAANLGMLEVFRVVSSSPWSWPVFGSGAPLWTLAIEFHIYIFVGALFFLARGAGAWAPLLLLAVLSSILPLSLLFGAAVPEGVGQSLFALWVAGFAFAHFPATNKIPIGVLLVIAVGGLSQYFVQVVPGKEYSASLYVYLILFFASLVFASAKTSLSCGTKAAAIVGQTADYSFTLYLVHYSLLNAMAVVLPAKSGWSVAVAVIVCNGVSILLAKYTERHHRKLSLFLWSIAGALKASNSKAPSALP